MRIVVSERLEGRNSQNMLLGSAFDSLKHGEAWRATHDVAVVCAYDLPRIQHMRHDA